MSERMLGLTRPMKAAWAGVRAALDDMDLPLAEARALEAARTWGGHRRFPVEHLAFSQFYLTEVIPEAMALVVFTPEDRYHPEVYCHPLTWQLLEGTLDKFERVDALKAAGTGLHWLDQSAMVDASLALLFIQAQNNPEAY